MVLELARNIANNIKREKDNQLLYKHFDQEKKNEDRSQIKLVCSVKHFSLQLKYNKQFYIHQVLKT